VTLGEDDRCLHSRYIFYLFPLYFALLVGLLAEHLSTGVVVIKIGRLVKERQIGLGKGVLFAEILVGFQFGMAAALVFIVSIIISQQGSYFRKGNLALTKTSTWFIRRCHDWSARG